MSYVQTHTCDCGHGWGLHDEFGCAAYLGPSHRSAGAAGRCRCRQTKAHFVPLDVVEATALVDDGPAAVVELRTRRGAAVGLCDSPPVLVFGGTADDVLSQVRERLRSALLGSGSPQRIRIVINGLPDRVELLS